ncbi:unnamed protein product, partial [Eretmochelys imbricata]
MRGTHARNFKCHGIPSFTMANPVPSACCMVLAAVVMVYAQRHSELDMQVQYERLGADVTMQCGAMDWDAAVTWSANGTDMDESHLNGSRLVLRNVDLTRTGQYACYEGSSWHLKYQTYLKVGTSPKEPVLMCRSNNYPKGFYCSWHLPSPTYIPNTFNITVMHGPRELVCEKDAFPKNRCHIRYLQLFSTVKYKVTLTVTNALGRNATTITFDEFAIGGAVRRDVPHHHRRLRRQGVHHPGGRQGQRHRHVERLERRCACHALDGGAQAPHHGSPGGRDDHHQQLLLRAAPHHQDLRPGGRCRQRGRDHVLGGGIGTGSSWRSVYLADVSHFSSSLHFVEGQTCRAARISPPRTAWGTAEPLQKERERESERERRPHSP